MVAAGASVTVLHIPSGAQFDEQIVAGPPPSEANNERLSVFAIPEPTARSGPLKFWQIHRNARARLSDGIDRQKFTHLHASDLYVLPAVAAVGVDANIHVSFDSRELYAHVAATKRKPWSRLAWHLLQKRYLPQCDSVFTVSDGIADEMANSFAIPRPIVVRNLPLHASQRHGTDVRTALKLPKNAFLCLHLGQARADRGCETAVSAVSQLDDMHLAFVGNAPLKARLASLAARSGASNRVHFLPPVPPELVTSFVRTADVGLSLLPRSCLNHELALPNKFFEYVSAGVPVVVSRLREMARLVADHQIGMSVEPSSVPALADALREIRNNPNTRSTWSGNCLQLSESMTWDHEKTRFVEAFFGSE